MFRPWNPMKQEIEIWLETKQLEFTQKDNKGSRYTPHQYLQRYVFTDLHEAYFCFFPELLQEWILRLKDTHPTNQIRPVVWTAENIVRLERVNNKFTCIVDFWLDNITAGFITEFAVDTTKSYTAVEKYFLKGPRGRYIRSLYTSIKILLHDKGVMTMESDN
jgi:hypothetical protein